MKRFFKNHQLGFTLIELLVVIVIIGILATLATVGLNSVRAKARDSKRISDIRQMQSALELYFNDNNGYPTNSLFVIGSPLVSPDGTRTYMSKIPSNPKPWAEGACVGFGTEYTYDSTNANTYTLTYCLAAKVNDLSSGVAKAWPGSINNACTPSCSGKVCGSDGCGGVCAPNSCAANKSCNSAGQCVAFLETWQSVDVDGPSAWKKPFISPDGTKAIVGYNNKLYYSADFGDTWATRTVPANMNNYAMSWDGANILAFTGSAFYRSTDSGATWPSNESWSACTGCVNGDKITTYGANGNTVLVKNSSDNYFYQSSLNGTGWSQRSTLGNFSTGYGFAISNDGTKIIYVNNSAPQFSSNSGSTFNSASGVPSGAWQMAAMSSDGTKMLVMDYNGGTAGVVYNSTNSGGTWSQARTAQSPYPNQPNNFSYSSDLSRVYGNNASGLYVSTDIGATWSLINNSAVAKGFGNSLHVSSNGLRAMATSGGFVYRSTDGGVNFTKVNTPVSPRNWVEVLISANGQKMLAIADGTFVGSSDYGMSWSQVNSSSQGCSYISGDANLQNIFCVRNGYDPIRISNDGGVTWADRTPSTLTSATRQWYDVEVSADGQKAVAVINNGYIYTTNDGGATWTERTAPGSKYWQYVAIDDSGNYMAASNQTSPGELWVSTNGGVTWTQKTTATNDSAWRIDISSDGSKMFVAGNGANMYKSSNSGSTFSTSIASPGSANQKICMTSDGQKMVLYTNGNQVYSSIDGGATWQLVSTGATTIIDIALSRDGSTAVILADGKAYISR